MPVLGHAFVGMATAIQTEPSTGRNHGPVSPLAAVIWMAAMVGLAYFPDAVTQVGASLGFRHTTLIGHSMLVGAAAGLALGAALAIVTDFPIVRTVLVAVGSIIGHDVLDVMQGSERPPLWPWSMKTFAVTPWIPSRTLSEGVLFLVLFLVFAAWRKWSGRSLGVGAVASQPAPFRWSAYGAVTAIVAAALLTLTLRSRHERLLNSASRLLDAGRFDAALQAADLADGWPRATRPGRIDLIRAEAYQGLGQPLIAEGLYLRAYDEDPTNFWAVADLAEFYASSDRPATIRHTLAAFYVAQLQERFGDHRALHRVLEGIDRRLARADRTESH